ncbi:MAG: hypothetical protein ACI4J1_12715 [Ruminiclostridium sp.]
MQNLYFFIVIFCGIFGFAKLISLAYCFIIDKLSKRGIYAGKSLKNRRNG